MFKKIFVISVALMLALNLEAKMVSDYLEMDDRPLHASQYESLKSQVVSYLSNSWCTPAKANMIMDLIVLTRPSVCVEIGAFTGSTVLPVAAALKYLNQGKIYAIDAWSTHEVIKNMADNDPNKSWWATVDMNSVYRTFLKMIRDWSIGSWCEPVRATSEQAAHQFATIDFLHIDGDYSEVGTVRDLELYFPKVKSGGYVLLSNSHITIDDKQPKLSTLNKLIISCEMVCEEDGFNSILFRKF